VARALLDGGPATAPELAERLGLAATVVRRHLETLLAADLVSAGERAPYGPAPARRRGRPARVYALTQAGRDVFDQGYDDLAVEVLRFLAEVQGEQGVQAFARRRVADLESRYSSELAGLAAPQRAEVLAQALSRDGYAADAVPAGGPGGGSQVCQHHCPVAHVATEFPQLCDAETEAFERLLGTRVLRLATIAHGDGVCTTHVPAAPPAPTRIPARPGRSSP
jgi:predicted ArsR family transcriptional regulator